MPRASRLSAILLIAAAACVSDRPGLFEPNHAISDGAHAGGTPGFYFLPPMVSQPDFSGVFDADIATLNPVVAICDLTDAPDVDCGGSSPGATVPVRMFTTTSTPSITVDADKYMVNWDTKEGAFVAGRIYRVHVRARTPSRELGFADILLTTEPGKAKHLADGETIVLNDGRTLPIHFRIEVGAGPANEAPVVDAGPDQTITQTTATLTGTVTDDGQPSGTLTTTWSQVSGPSTLTFGDPNASGTTATVSAAGAYVLRLSASDGELTGQDDMILSVGGTTVNWTGAAGDFDWNTAGNWDVQRAPGPFDDVIVASAGETPVTHGAGANTIQSLTVEGSSAIALTGGSLTVNGTAAITSGVVTLEGGTLARAVVMGSGAVLALSESGTLDGVTLGADVTLTVPSAATLTLLNGLTLDGQLILTGGEPLGVFARVEAVGSQTIGGSGTVLLGGNTFNFLGAITPGTTLTLGSALTLRGGGALLGAANTQVLNEGNILLGVLSPGIATINGLTNIGTLAVSNASNLTLLEAWSNADGTIQLDNSTMNIRGSVTTNGLGTWQRTNGTVNLSGTLTNSGATLDVDAIGIGTVRLSSATIVGGTVALGSATTTPLTLIGASTLDGVTLAAGLTLTIQSPAQLTIRNGLTLHGQLVVTGNPSQPGALNSVRFDGTQALGGTGEVVLDVAGQNNVLFGTTGTTLTLGPSITVRGTGSVQPGSDGTLISQGAIRANVSGRTLTVSNLTNEGTVAATGGSTLTLNGPMSNTGTIQLVDAAINLAATFATGGLGTWHRTNGTVSLIAAGILTNTGATLNVDESGVGVIRLAGGMIVGGSIVPGTVTATPLVLATGVSGTLDGVTLEVGLTVPGSATLTVRNGLTLNAQLLLAGTANATLARVNAVGNQTWGGSGEVVLGGVGNFNALGGPLTVAPSLTIRGAGSVGLLVNEGAIRADVAGLALAVGGVNNVGILEAINGASLTLNGPWTNAGGTIRLTGATVNLGGGFTPASLGTWQRTGGTVNLVSDGGLGVLTNTGGTLDVDASGMGQLRLAGGTIRGGTVAPGSVTATPLVMGPGTSSLDGVTLSPALTLTVPGGANLRLVNGLTLDGNLILTGSPGSTATVNTVQAQTIGGTGDIAMAGSGAQNFIRPSTFGTLTLAPSLTVHGAGTLGSTSAPMINQGVVRADAPGGITVTGFTNSGMLSVINPGSLTFTGTWSNAGGTLELVDGTVSLGGTFAPAGLGTWHRTNGTVNLTGTLTNTGGTLDVDASGMGALRLSGGTLVGGTVVVGSATTATPLVMGSGGTGTLDGVTLAPGVTFTVPGGATLTLRNGLTLNGGLTMAGVSVALRATVTTVGTQTVGGTGVVILGTATDNGVFAGGTLTLGPSLTVRGAGIVGLAGALVVNLGTITPDVPGQAIRANNLTNNGIVSVPANGLVAMAGTFTNGSSGTLSIEIGGGAIGQFGRVTVTGPGATGPANLGGTLNASVVGGFVPAAGDRFRFMTFLSRNGAFATTMLPPGFTLETHATDLELVAP